MMTNTYRMLLLVLIVGFCSRMDARRQVRVGLLIPFNSTDLIPIMGFSTTAGAVMIALDRIRNEHIVDDVDFSFYWEDSQCDEAVSIGAATKLVLESKVDVILGPPCSAGAFMVAAMAKYFNTAVVGWGASFYEARDTVRFPTFARTDIGSDDLARAVGELMDYFEWVEFALMYSDDMLRRECYYIKQGLDIVFADPAYTFISVYPYVVNGSPSTNDYDIFLDAVKPRARIVILCLDNPEDERDFMVRVHERGMDTDEYVYLLPDLHDNDGDVGGSILAGSVNVGTKMRWNDRSPYPDGKDDLAKKGYEKSIVITVDLAAGEKVDKFRKEIPIRMKQPPFNCGAMCDGPEVQYGSTFSPYLHDSMYVYALSLNKTLKMDPINGQRNGSMILQNCESNFSGMTGDVVMTRTGNRLPTFVVRGFDQYLNFIDYAFVNVSQPNGQTIQLNVSSASVFWGTRNGGVQPLSRPICGYSGLECPKSFLDLYLPYVILGSCIAAVLVFLSISGFTYSIYSRMKSIKLQNQLWQVSYSNLQRVVEKENTLSQSSLPSSGRSNASSLVESLFKNMSGRKCKNYEFYFYNGQPAAAAKTQAHFAIKDEADFAEFRAMRELSHENVNKFIGICLDGPNFLSLWRFCKRGSLKDVIKRGHLTLDWFFKYSLINDIATGLEYLSNSPLKVHGNITSRTCLVDDRWQVMLSDFGLRVVRQAEKLPSTKLLWTAPELLRSGSKEGTAAGDIYSFAIVCSEILTTKKAFEDKMTEANGAEGIIYNVMKEQRAHPFRPSLSTVGPEVNPAMVHLIKDCWSEKVQDRPHIRIVRGMLKAMMSGRNANLMDHVMSMMEKYAVTLEQQVDERTKQLVEEQKKSDILLYRMLPRQVADKLKAGQSVEPEAFDNVTIFFSDVVGFTNIASRCSPLQVVNLLNDLYTLFDGIIEAHDVYKVETIGDGYLCVSGLPHRNGDMHAREIADMALEFMRSLASFRIHNLPNEQINLRIGIHTGSCVTGVVGMSMPRYCLFGDSVNTASRMESHGKAGQIHITAETNRYLTYVIGGYKTAERGDVIIKGKGVLLTYWLVGKTDVTPAAPGTLQSDPAVTQMYESYKASINEMEDATRPMTVASSPTKLV